MASKFPLFLAGAALLVSSMAAQPAATKESVPLQALTPAFWKIFDRGAQLQVMGRGFGFTEGPVWDRSGFLFVSDEEKNGIYRLFPDGRSEQVIALGDPDGNTYDHQGRLIDCASVLRAIILLSPDKKTYTVLADRYEGKRFNSPNDVVPGPDGALYFTDPTLDLVQGAKQEIPFQGVYRLGAKGEVTLLSKDLDQPNGLAFSPDGRFLYVDDSARRNIRRYRFHADGTLSDGVLFADEKIEGTQAVPDGMKLDRNGNLFVTGPGGIWIWSPAGEHLGTILVPEQPANLAWGGPDDSTLFITAGTSVYRISTQTKGFTVHPRKDATQ
jgi:gluconolactonase